MVFVLDTSESIREHDYWVVKQFTVDVVKGLNNNNNDEGDATHVGMVTFSDDATTHWKLLGEDGDGAEGRAGVVVIIIAN